MTTTDVYDQPTEVIELKRPKNYVGKRRVKDGQLSTAEANDARNAAARNAEQVTA